MRSSPPPAGACARCRSAVRILAAWCSYSRQGDSNMTLFRTVLLTSGLVLAFCGAADAREAAAGGKMVTLQMPALPDPVRVTLDPKTTALLVLDYVDDICN